MLVSSFPISSNNLSSLPPPLFLHLLLILSRLSLSSSSSTRTLVDYIQSQLSLIIHSTPITQATSLLTPFRGALQASVTLHALITIQDGLLHKEVSSMRNYLQILLQNEDYQRILPEDSFIFLQHVYSILSDKESSPDMPYSSQQESISEEKHQLSDQSGELSQKAVHYENPSENPIQLTESLQVPGNFDPRITHSKVILLEETLLSSFPSIVRSLSFASFIHRALTQSNLEYVCRSLHGPHFIIDINTAVFCIDHQIILNPNRLKEFITTISLMFPRYSTIHILLLLTTMSIPEIASNILALQAGILLIPLHITLHYA